MSEDYDSRVRMARVMMAFSDALKPIEHHEITAVELVCVLTKLANYYAQIARNQDVVDAAQAGGDDE